MRTSIALGCMFAASLTAWSVSAQESGMVKPNLVLSQVVAGMPAGNSQQVRVMTATFQHGDRTVFHTHRWPVTVYVVEGAFTLEMEGHEPVTVRAGEAMVEPPNVKMTGYNRSATEQLKAVIFYVSDEGSPFLDPVHQ
jgi:quercetin dioxygenase-like cupin family protein